jgi:hypothetical protein
MNELSSESGYQPDAQSLTPNEYGGISRVH